MKATVAFSRKSSNQKAVIARSSGGAGSVPSQNGEPPDPHRSGGQNGAGLMSVMDAIRSGTARAATSAMVPPIELHTRWTLWPRSTRVFR